MPYVYSNGENAYIGYTEDTKPIGNSKDVLIEIDRIKDMRNVYQHDGTNWVLQFTADNKGSITDDVKDFDNTKLGNVMSQLADMVNQLNTLSLPIRAVVAGDSTAAGDGNNAIVKEGWFETAIYKSRKLVRIYNAGIGGNTISQLYARLQSDVINKNPHICALIIGRNDMGNGKAGPTAVRDTMRLIVSELLGNGILPIICSIVPASTTSENTDIDKTNNYLYRIAETYRIPYVDFNSFLKNSSTGYFNASLTSDSIHPNNAGKDIMADQFISQFINKILCGCPRLCSSNIDSDNLISNGMFLIDTNSDGVPDGWAFQGGSGGTPSIEVGDSNVVGNKFRITKATTDLQYYRLTTAVTWAVGDTLQISGVMSVSTSNGLMPQIKITFSGAPTESFTPIAYSTTRDRFLFSMEFIVPTGATSIKIDFIVEGGTGYGEISQLTLHNKTAYSA